MMVASSTHKNGHADYSDCVRNFREYAVLLDQLSASDGFDSGELNEIVAYLQQSANSLERRDRDAAVSA